MLESVLRVVDRSEGLVVVHECRVCGTTLESGSARCEYCGPTDVVRYEIR